MDDRDEFGAGDPRRFLITFPVYLLAHGEVYRARRLIAPTLLSSPDPQGRPPVQLAAFFSDEDLATLFIAALGRSEAEAVPVANGEEFRRLLRIFSEKGGVGHVVFDPEAAGERRGWYFPIERVLASYP
jgi:hypothetical protein